MKKILLGFFLFCIFGVSQGFSANINNETFLFGVGSGSSISFGSSGSISMYYVNPVFGAKTLTGNIPNTSEVLSSVCGVETTGFPYRALCYVFVKNGLSQIQAYNILSPSTGTPTTLSINTIGSTFSNLSLYSIPSLSRNCIEWGSTTKFCSYIASNGIANQTTTSPRTLIGNGEGYFINVTTTIQAGPDFECSTINQPSTGLQSLNTGPYENITTSGSESKYFKTGTGNFIGFINLNIEESDILDFLENDIPLSFSTKGLPYIFEAISTPTIYFGSDKGIDTINLSDSNIGPIEVLFLDKSGNVTNTQEYTNTSEISFPKTDALLVRFGKSFSDRTLESFDFKSESPSIVPKVLCLNLETGDYTLDGEDFTGNTGSLNEIEDIPINEWTFSTSGYQFYENGFCLANFVPSPYGGKLFFEIVNPLGENLTTGFLLPYDIKGRVQGQEPGNGYGFDSCPKITTFYHEEPGNYKVRVKYEYNGKSLYPFGNDYNSYTITLPERAGAGVNVWETESCGADTEGTLFLPGVSKFFSCLSETISNFFKDQYESIKRIGSLLYKLSDIFTTEVKKPFGYIKGIFIMQTYAENPYIKAYSENGLEEGSVFGRLHDYMKGLLSVIALVFFLGVIIFVKSTND